MAEKVDANVNVDHIDKLDKLTGDVSKLQANFETMAKDFTEMKIHTIEHTGKLETVLAALQATLEMSVEEHKRFDSELSRNTGDIHNLQNDVTNIKNDVKNLDSTVTNQGSRIKTIEKISYWVYGAIAAVTIIAYIVAHYAIGRDVINHHREQMKEIHNIQNTVSGNATTQSSK